jgi:hypothetical protein
MLHPDLGLRVEESHPCKVRKDGPPAAATYNVEKATCGSNCVQCTATNTDAFLAAPFNIAVGGQSQLTCTEVLRTGHHFNCTGGGTWSSTQPSMATVSAGLVTGVSAGAMEIDDFLGYEQSNDGSMCIDPPIPCPEEPIPVTPVQGAVQIPTYFFSPTETTATLPPACTQDSATGVFLDVSYYVAAADSTRISQSGMAPGENVGSGWNDAFATPSTTGSDGSFDDVPVGACFVTPGHFCATGHPQSFRLTSNGKVNSISTNTTSKECTDGIQLVIQGNPTSQNKTYTVGNTQ